MASKAQVEHTSKDYYFDSYSHFGIHEEMLKDEVRTRTYMRAILDNAHQFKGKAVLDVGCGTGILSMFAAKAGARAVYAVDMSSIAQQATQIVKDNGFEGVITVYQAKMEDVALPEKVDIIISEWMGYALFYESMLPAVLHARDQWLQAGGLILPDRCNVYIAAIEDEEYKQEKIEFWSNVYGFSMEPIKQMARSEPLVDTVQQDLVNSSVAKLASIDIRTMAEAEAAFSGEFELKFRRNDNMHAIVLWFDVVFGSSHKELSFTTSPFARTTHWKQVVFYLEEKLVVCKDEVFRGTLTCAPNALNPRDQDFTLLYTFAGAHCEASETLQYRMR